MTEEAWLLRDESGGAKAIEGMIECALVELASAALMDLAEREGIDTVLTLDRRDFSIYRTTDGRALAVTPKAWHCDTDPPESLLDRGSVLVLDKETYRISLNQR